MFLDLNKKKLFDDAYNKYLNIKQIINAIYEDAKTNPFSELPSEIDVICSLDLFIHSILTMIAVADREVTDEEREFIISLPDGFEEICARNKGYKRFISLLNQDLYNEKASFYYNYDAVPLFYTLIKENDSKKTSEIVDELKNIFNDFVAIDDVVSERENAIILKSIRQLCPSKEQNIDRRNTTDNPTMVGTCDNVGMVLSGNDEICKALRELDELVGLTDVKQEISSIINLLTVNNLRKSKGLPELQISNHMVFLGNPGTGKTTVARIIAQIFKALGVVSKGQLVETDRSGLVAGYVGQTAQKTAQVIKKAKGGVLFIDEAYSLASSEGSNDYGREAIDTLVKGMEDYRDDLVVIVAGYTNEMQKFIDMNPGLRSRFNKYVLFQNYRIDELLEIFKHFCESSKFVLTNEAEIKAKDYFNMNKDSKDFGNARGVRNFFDRVVMKQATRVVSMKDPTEDDIKKILPDDMQNF